MALTVVLLVQVLAGDLFGTPRVALFDFYERFLPRHNLVKKIVIVEADDASLKLLGQWPWPRQTEARLFAKILAARPAVLGLDLILPEPDRLSPEAWIRQEGIVPPPLAEQLRRLPDHDRQLAEVIASGPVVAGIGGLNDSRSAPDRGRLAPFRLIGASTATLPTTILPRFDSALRSVPTLDNAAAGNAILSVVPDTDGIFRRIPLAFALSGRIAPSLDLELLRVAEGEQWMDLYLDNGGVAGFNVGPFTIPTQIDGSVWVDFSSHDPGRFVSAADVFAGRVAAARFAHQIVIFSATATGTHDWHYTPVGAMPGTEIHAQLLENILTGRLARRPGWARIVETLLTIAVAFLLILILPRLRSRLQPPFGLLLLVLLAVSGVALWWKERLLLDVATPAIAGSLVFVALLGGQFAEADAQRKRLRRELEEKKLAAAKTEGELVAARRIQLGLLPQADSVADTRLELSALIVPAREIGGDLYDFFKVDDNRLFFSVADVSGKGVPAALFMTVVKSLCKSLALRERADIAEIMIRTNREISRDNSEMLFVTMLAGILDLSTGEAVFCNAGHDAPWLLRFGEPPRQIPAAGGPPLCIVDDYAYGSSVLRLEPGDVICLTTDGVAEAMDDDGCVFGRERVAAELATLPPESSARAVTEELHATVQRFSAEEPYDDLTILTLRWRPGG